MPLWSKLRCWAWSVVPAWPTAFAALIYLLLLLGNDQIEDAVLGAAQDWIPAGANALWFYAWNLIFALVVWFWARLLLGFARPIPAGLPAGIGIPQVRNFVEPIVVWLPRILGALVAIGPAASFWRIVVRFAHLTATSSAPAAPPKYAFGLGMGMVIVFVIYSIFVLVRRPAARLLSKAITNPALKVSLRPTKQRIAIHGPGSDPLNPIAVAAAIFWAALSVVATGWSLVDPVGLGQSFGGAISIIPIGLAGICTGLSVCAWVAMRYHAPVFAGILLLAIISSYTMDNHQLASVPSDPTTKPPTLDEAYQAFKPEPGRKLLLVATAGGGIRAAYWTAYALSRLHDDPRLQKQFDNALFAISGVSGGSYGAVVYRAMLATKHTPPCANRNPGPDDKPPANFADCVYLYLGWDALGPTVVSLLFPDLQQRFIPFSLLPDRAHALELTWQKAWAERAPEKSQQDLLKNAFHGLWSDSPLPVLLLNGTSVSVGHRIITTNVMPNSAATAFHDVAFFSQLMDREIAATTAATNSARFPIISPPGTIVDGRGTATDQIVDGGLFENSGAQTLLDLYNWLVTKSAGQNLDIGVLQITSDPDQADPTGKCGPKLTANTGMSRFLPDLTSPFDTLLATRSARGTAEVEALQARVQTDYHTQHPNDQADKAPYFGIRLSRTDAPTFEPLGWQLSGAAKDAIGNAWTNTCNEPDLDRLRGWLGVNTSQ